MLKGNEQQPQQGLKERILDALRKRNILPQQRKEVNDQQPAPPNTFHVDQPLEAEEERDIVTSDPEPPTFINQTAQLPPREENHTPEQPIDRIRQLVRTRVPEQVLNPENIDSFDSLFFSQLWENINRSDALRYTGTTGEETTYVLPFEMRQFDGEYYPFIPRVEGWYFIRSLPVAT